MQTLGKDLDPQPGDLLLLRIKGVVGWLVWLLQLINGDTSKWTHVAVCLDEFTLFEAQPGGAQIVSIGKYADRPMTIVRHYQQHGNPSTLLPLSEVLTDSVRKQIALYAREMDKVGYNWGTYVYLALFRIGVRTDWIVKHIQDDDRVICSQAGDLAYDLAGVHLFADNRMPYDVTPGDIATLQ
jgi:hypothetical protein